MDEKADLELLRDYAERGSEAAFRGLVRRYTDLVYSAALRQVSSADVARDVAQEVFTDLAAKAKVIVGKSAAEASLAGWLFRSTRFLALNHLRDEDEMTVDLQLPRHSAAR
jgi:DNA-directed RNA polymerase specialized sigma24 family protein